MVNSIQLVVVSGSGGVQPIRPALRGVGAVVVAMCGRRNKTNQTERGCLSGKADGHVAL